MQGSHCVAALSAVGATLPAHGTAVALLLTMVSPSLITACVLSDSDLKALTPCSLVFAGHFPCAGLQPVPDLEEQALYYLVNATGFPYEEPMPQRRGPSPRKHPRNGRLPPLAQPWPEED